MNPAQKALLEKRDGWDVGRDPRQVSRDELNAAGHRPMSPLKALRVRCIDCKGGELSGVRRCGHLDCPAWPYRMRTNPWRQEPSEAQRQSAARLACGMKNHAVQLGRTDGQAVPATILPPAKLSTDETAVLGDPTRRAAGSREALQEALRAAGHKPMSPLRALRLRCVDCCADQPNEVRLCTAVTCPSWPFRMGANPWREVSDGRREAGLRLAARQARGAQNRKSDLSADAKAEGVAVIVPPATLSTGETPVSDVRAQATASGEAVR